jgi:hypothetical protein
MSVQNILEALDSEIAKLAKARTVLAGLKDSSAGRAITAGSEMAKRIVSAASRRKMAIAQRARWAGKKKKQATAAVTSTAKPIRVISAPVNRKMAVAQRARWAKFRAAKKAA